MERLLIIISCLTCQVCLSMAQGILVGNVSDGDVPLGSATVTVPALQGVGTSTDPDGNFSLQLPAGKHTVNISFIRYQSKQVVVEIVENRTFDLGTVVLETNHQLDEVAVTGMYAKGEMEAVTMRRNSLAIMDVMSADAIGKLPDINAAEAVQRVSGVSIDRDQGEGRYVTVRGTPSQWSSTTINGDRMPAAKTSGALLGNRTVPMDLIPADFIQHVQVVKAITPDYEGDAIGGTVNFVPRTSPEGRVLRVSGTLPYHAKSNNSVGYNGVVVYGDRYLKDRLGLLVSASVNSRPYATDSYVVIYGNELHNVNTLDVRNYQGSKRTNTGFNAAADYRISPQSTVYIRGYYTELLDNERNRKTMHHFNRPTNNAELRWSAVDYWFRNYGGEVGLQTHFNDRLSVTARASVYHSWAGYKGPTTVDRDLRGYYYGNWLQTVQYANLAEIDGVSYKFLKGDEPVEGYQGDDHNNIQPHFDPATPYNPDNYFLDRYTLSIRNILETDRVGAFDFDYRASDGLSIKFGGKYRHKKSDYDFRYATWTYDASASPALLNQWERERFPAGQWFPEMNNVYDNLKFDYPTLGSFINPVGNQTINEHLTYQMQDRTNSHYATGNYDAVERVWAGYVMGEWNINSQMALIPGFRYEATGLRINSYAFDDVSREVTPVNDERSFGSFLPMVHFLYKPNDKLDMRAAVTRTFARAAFNHLSPTTRLNENTQVIVMGNPGLRPTYSWNYDLIGSYYIGGSSYFTGSLFYKNITDLIYEKQHEEYRNIEGETLLYQVSQPVNSDNAFLYGLELGYNQRFTSLPGFWSGFGLNLNYTYTQSETTLEEREGEKVGLMNQSPNIVNATLFYEKSRFALRLAANYRQAFLMVVRSNSGADRYQDDDFHLDLNLSYTFMKNLTLFADVNNLTNQPLRYYHGVSRRPETVEFYSRRGRVGINWNL